MNTGKLCAIAALMTGVSLASAAPAATAVQITNTVMRDVESKGADGHITRQRVAATRVAPGDKVVYVIALHNGTGKPADRLVVTNPVPADLEFVGASDGAEVSVDGGKTYGALAEQTVRAASGGSRAAQAADVTHVRWRLATAVAPSASGDVSFEARVR